MTQTLKPQLEDGTPTVASAGLHMAGGARERDGRASVAPAGPIALLPRDAEPRVFLAQVVGSGQDGVDQELAARFERQHEVEEVYYGRNLGVAAALTVSSDDPDTGQRIHIACGPDVRLDDSIQTLLFDVAALYRQADLTLKGRTRRIFLSMLFGVVAELFKVLDRAAAVRTSPDERLGCTRIQYLRRGCERARGYFERSTQRHAQVWYFLGMLGGLAAVAVLAFLLPLGLERLPNLESSSGQFLVSLGTGSCGAVVSVMYGMTSGSLRLNYLVASGESGRGVLVFAGSLRPLVGAMFGVVLYVLLISGLLPLDIPDDPERATFFHIAVAFLAGFSERWARGILDGTEENVGGSGTSERRPPAEPPGDPGRGLEAAGRSHA
jgi:hypothetical protein